MSTLSKIGIVLLATIIFILLLPFIFIIGFMVVVSIATAYVLPSAQAGGSVIMEQAVKESATNPLNAPTGFVAPSTEAPAETPATPEAE